MRAAKLQAVEAFKPYRKLPPEASPRIHIISQEIIKVGRPTTTTSTVTSSTITSTQTPAASPPKNPLSVVTPAAGLSVLEDLLVSEDSASIHEIDPKQQAVLDAISKLSQSLKRRGETQAVTEKPTVPSLVKQAPAVAKFRNNSRVKDLATTITKTPASRATLFNIKKAVEADVTLKEGKPFRLPNLDAIPKRPPSPTFARFNPGLACVKPAEPAQNITIVHHNYAKARGQKQPKAQQTEYQFMSRCQRRNYYKRLNKEKKSE